MAKPNSALFAQNASTGFSLLLVSARAQASQLLSSFLASLSPTGSSRHSAAHSLQKQFGAEHWLSEAEEILCAESVSVAKFRHVMGRLNDQQLLGLELETVVHRYFVLASKECAPTMGLTASMSSLFAKPAVGQNNVQAICWLDQFLRQRLRSYGERVFRMPKQCSRSNDAFLMRLMRLTNQLYGNAALDDYNAEQDGWHAVGAVDCDAARSCPEPWLMVEPQSCARSMCSN